MSIKAKTLTAIIVLGLLDAVVLGLPIVALILIYAIFFKPPWFAQLVHKIYAN